MSIISHPSIFRLFAAGLVVATQVSAVEAPIQDLAVVHRQAHEFLQEQVAERFGEQVTVTLAQPDSRLRLLDCHSGLSTFIPPGVAILGSTTVGVRCVRPQPWTIYLSGRVSVWRMVVVSNRPLSRNEILSDGDFELQKRDLGKLTRGYIESQEDVLGMEVRRSVAANIALTAGMLRAPVVIQRGEIITLVSHSVNLEVSMQARALSAGALGQRVVVENTATRKHLNGIVHAPGVVWAGRAPESLK